MKKFFLSIACLAMAVMTASAQFMGNSGGSQSRGVSRSYQSDDNPSHYWSIWLTYSPLTLTTSYSGGGYDDDGGSNSDKVNFTAFSLDITHANKLFSIPLYIDYGLRTQFAFNKESGSATNLLSIGVPVGVLYRFAIPNTTISIVPYTGFDFIVRAMFSANEGGKSMDLFNYLKQQGVELNRFNMDWHIGARVMFGKFFLAASYELPLVGLYDKDSVKMGFSMANISLGVAF